MARIEPPPEGALDQRTRDLLDRIADIHGFVPNQHKIEAHVPLLLRSLLDLNRRVMLGGDLDPALLEAIAFVLAVENNCPYCKHYHATVLAERGLSEDEIDMLQENWREGRFSSRERTLIRFSLRVNENPHEITDADIEELFDAGMDEADVVQLVHFVNLMRAYNTFNVVLDTDVDAAEGGWVP